MKGQELTQHRPLIYNKKPESLLPVPPETCEISSDLPDAVGKLLVAKLGATSVTREGSDWIVRAEIESEKRPRTTDGAISACCGPLQ